MANLKALLTPASIAVLGASRRKGSVGNTILVNLENGNYGGQLFVVNPAYETLEDRTCYPTLSDLPIKVDHVILAVGDERIESAFNAVVEHQARACTIFTSMILDSDEEPLLKERIRKLAEDAGISLLGANCMGFYNFTHNVRVCGFATRSHPDTGNVTLISQSGSGMSGILNVDERINFNFAASTGQELDVGLEELLDYALDLPSTKVVGLFMETCRKPRLFLQALEKANKLKIPIVVIKVGKSELAAALAVSHSGALAGRDDVFESVFDKYGVQRVDDMNQLATALIMFAQPHPVAQGGLATIHDSGGERQLLADLALKLDVPLTHLNERSRSELDKILDPGMPAVNPLDAWSKAGPDADDIMKKGFSILMSDPGTALGAVIMDRGPAGRIYNEYLGYLKGDEETGHDGVRKPVFLVSNHQGIGSDNLALEITQAGFPVLDGLAAFLVGVRCLIRYRDYLTTPSRSPPRLPEDVKARWNTYFENDLPTGESVASQWLSECGIPMAVPIEVANVTDLQSLSLTFPVVLKTAAPGIAHKSDVDGVRLNIGTPEALLLAYQDISSRLGPAVIVTSMVGGKGLEMILGLIQDAQFGPVIVMGLGGTQTELLNDVVMVLPPFDASVARRALLRLKHRNLFEGSKLLNAGSSESSAEKFNNTADLDMDSFCEAAAIFSVAAMEFSDVLLEVDINPVKVLSKGCIGLDALLVRKDTKDTKDTKGK